MRTCEPVGVGIWATTEVANDLTLMASLFIRVGCVSVALLRLCTGAGDVLQGAPVKVNDFTIDSLVFACPAWRSTFHSGHGRVACTTGGHRQPDAAFRALLDRCRWGSITDADVLLINSTWSSFKALPGQTASSVTKIRILKSAVIEINRSMLAHIDEPLWTYPSEDVVLTEDEEEGKRASAELHEHLDSTFEAKVSCPVILTRKVGAPPTGTRGTIVGFNMQARSETAGESTAGGSGVQTGTCVVCEIEGQRVDVVRQRFSVYNTEGVELAFVYQIPLLLCWALTVHRAQGLNLDAVDIDLSDDMWTTNGLVYAALSRCRTFAGLRVRGLTKALVRVSSLSRRYMATQMHAAGVLDEEATKWFEPAPEAEGKSR